MSEHTEHIESDLVVHGSLLVKGDSTTSDDGSWIDFDPTINGLGTAGTDPSNFKGGRYKISGKTMHLHATFYQGSNAGVVNGSGRYGFLLPGGHTSRLLTADDFGRIVGTAQAFVVNSQLSGSAVMSSNRQVVELLIGGYDGFNGLEWQFLNNTSHGFSGFESAGEVYFSIAAVIEIE